MENPSLEAAYRRERSYGYTATPALQRARDVWATHLDASANYAAASEIRESAHNAANEVKGYARSLASAGGSAYEAAAQAVTEAVAAYDQAQRVERAALKTASSARSRCTYYPKTSGAGGGATRAAYGARAMRWVELPATCGLRFVGYASDIVTRLPTGYYLDAFCELETVRGVVYQLPARNGVARFVAGIDDPYNTAADDGGAAYISLEIYESEPCRDAWETDAADLDACRDAASAADGIAERYAEDAREYDTAWQAGNQARDKSEEIRTLKAELRETLRERRELKEDPARGKALSIVELAAWCAIDNIQQARTEIDELRSGDHGDLIFYPDERLSAAFNEGFGG